MSQGTVYAAPKRPDIIPANYDELFTAYYDYVVSLVVTSGIDVQNAEDVAMTILATFFEKDVLSDFDPNRHIEYGGVVRKAVFRTFLSGFVKIYVRHYRDRQNISKSREPIILDTPMNDGTDSGALIDFIGLVHNDDHSGVSYDRFVRSVSNHLSTIKPAGHAAKCTLSVFFEAVASQVKQTGHLNVIELANSLGMGETSAYNWLHRLRDELSKLSL